VEFFLKDEEAIALRSNTQRGPLGRGRSGWPYLRRLTLQPEKAIKMDGLIEVFVSMVI